MPQSLLRWLLVGVIVAVLAAGATIGGLMLLFPRHAPQSVAAVSPSVKSDAPLIGTPVPPELQPRVSIMPPTETQVSPATVAEAEPPGAAAATATGRDYVILQIGDSHTAADLFTGEVRDRLQAKFGAGGLFLPPGIPKAGVQSAEFEIRADDAWTYEAMSAADQPDRFWLSGYTASANQSGAMVSFMARGQQAFDSIDVSFLKTNGGGQAELGGADRHVGGDAAIFGHQPGDAMGEDPVITGISGAQYHNRVLQVGLTLYIVQPHRAGDHAVGGDEIDAPGFHAEGGDFAEQALAELERIWAANVAEIAVTAGTDAATRLGKRYGDAVPQAGDGESFRLTVNFSDMNILADQLASFGPEVLVLSPQELREKVLARLEATAAAHDGTGERHG